MSAAEMSHDALNACAELVAKGDPDRFLAAMTGTPEERKLLFPLYAFNLEIARAPFMSNEPMVGLVRLQFWRDVIEGKTVATHEVAGPLRELLASGELDAMLLARMIDMRERDVDGIGRVSASSIIEYAEGTSGALIAASVHGDPKALNDLGTASGIANWLLSLPELSRAGRGHVQPTEDLVTELAAEGLRRLAIARRTLPRQGSAALRSAWRAGGVLTRAKSAPHLANEGALGGSEFARRGRLLWLSTTGRW
ncbi:squalene/phytoene synthase family protein [Aliiroseovarius sp. KMU-50]|uniref:Squalene/phytoene synthase family protein n=1 Tax=Aliiroseovarius salicola TaxID=3009082 RepID=A0ABT4W6W1_9RHOB|nr:squalene/phytoene synthase family protein [Aliiroseovarius sp. KMU-50]MDA5095717.1 squalene/phytoene synthase family protein [Aliiroseovarius sp. KMU-50]